MHKRFARPNDFLSFARFTNGVAATCEVQLKALEAFQEDTQQWAKDTLVTGAEDGVRDLTEKLRCIKEGVDVRGDDLGCQTDKVVQASAEQLHSFLDKEHKGWDSEKKIGLVQARSADGEVEKK